MFTKDLETQRIISRVGIKNVCFNDAQAFIDEMLKVGSYLLYYYTNIICFF